MNPHYEVRPVRLDETGQNFERCREGDPGAVWGVYTLEGKAEDLPEFVADFIEKKDAMHFVNAEAVLENAVNIAYYLGVKQRKLAEEDSREHFSRIMYQAKRFEDIHADTDWNIEGDYIEKIDEFSQELIDAESFPL